MKKIISIFLVLVSLLASCEVYTQDNYQQYYAIEAYLIANNSLPSIWLTKTTSMQDDFYWDSVGVTNADVEIRLLKDNNEIEERYPYEHRKVGKYYPTKQTKIQPEQRYQFHAVFSDGDTMTAETYVPASFETVNNWPQEYEFEKQPSLSAVVTPSYYPNRQTHYFITANKEDPTKEMLTPFYADLTTKGGNFKAYKINNVGITNEKSYKTDDDGNIIVQIPWSLFAFYGKNHVVINAIDDNIYDFWRSHGSLTNNMTLSPGEIQNIDYNIDGGIGIFGSMANDTNKIDITSKIDITRPE